MSTSNISVLYLTLDSVIKYQLISLNIDPEGAKLLHLRTEMFLSEDLSQKLKMKPLISAVSVF